MGLRVGLSGGEVAKEEDDYFGDPVIEAARLCGRRRWADPGRGRGAGYGRSAQSSRGATLGALILKGLADPVGTVARWCGNVSRGLATDASAPADASGVRPAVGVVGRGARWTSMKDATKRVAGGEGREVLACLGRGRSGQDHAGGRGGPGGLRRRSLCAVRPLRGGPRHPLPTLRRSPRPLRHPRSRKPAPRPRRRARVRTGPPGPGACQQNPGPPASKATDADTERYLLFAAVVGLLATVSQHQPVVLVLDDLQWADKGSLLLLRHLAAAERHAGAHARTYRDSELSRSHPLLDTLAALRRQSGVTRIELAGWTTTGWWR